MRISHTKNKFKISALVAILLFFTGCGGTAYRDGVPVSNIGSPQNPSAGTTPVPAPTQTVPSNDDVLPAYSYSFSFNGAGEYITPSINTDSILKVKITSGAAERSSLPQGILSNASMTYGCLGFTVTALGQSKSTGILSVNGGNSICAGVPDSKVIDFSSRLTPGHGPVTIKVSKPLYDLYCQWYWSGALPYYGYGVTAGQFCPLHTVLQQHTVSGTIEIQVNGTSSP